MSKLRSVLVVAGAALSLVAVTAAARGFDSSPSARGVDLVSAVTSNGVRVNGWPSAGTVASATTSTLTARVRSAKARTVVVDIEVYKPSGERVFQKYWTGRSLKAGTALTLSTPWRAPAVAGTYRVAVGVFADGWSSLLVWNNRATSVTVTAAPTAAPTATITPTARPTTPPPTTSPPSTTPPTTSPTTSPTTQPTATSTPTGTTGGSAPTHFGTLAVGATLPSGAQCAAWVRALPTPAEVKGVNKGPNSVEGRPIAGATGLNTRVDGAFTGTTEQILRWTACKWGIDEDVVKAQAAVESWWRMDTKGDWGTDATRCAPGHGLGLDGTAGQCPESFGLLQVRYPYNQAAFPYAATSSAFNADYAYAQWRNCYVGNLTWLNTVDRVGTYAAGDSSGCLGVWFSGRWHTSAAEGYITKVQSYLDQRIWTTADFKQP